MSILIKDVILGKEKTSVFIEGNTIKSIGAVCDADEVLDGAGKAVIPGLVNTHTHAAMTLFRSYADDMELHDWLNNKIWPAEAKLTEKDIYWGTKLACLEMIKSGTTTFNDQYFMINAGGKAVKETGMRAFLASVFLDVFDKDDKDGLEEKAKKAKQMVAELECDRIKATLGPHAIYTNSEEKLRWFGEYSRKNDMLIHFHLSETEKENKDCIEKYGKSPVEALEEFGFLGPNLVCAHSVWLNENEIKILAKHDVKISHNPISNMKLAVGSAIPYDLMKSNGLVVSLGTDGTASNNNLDMFDSMKFAAILQKYHTNVQTALPAQDAFDMATINGAKALGINAGLVKEGMLADLVLIDLKKPELTPGHNLISDLVYSANGSCADTVIIDGKVVMKERKVEGEEEILEKSAEIGFDLVNRK